MAAVLSSTPAKNAALAGNARRRVGPNPLKRALAPPDLMSSGKMIDILALSTGADCNLVFKVSNGIAIVQLTIPAVPKVRN